MMKTRFVALMLVAGAVVGCGGPMDQAQDPSGAQTLAPGQVKQESLCDCDPLIATWGGGGLNHAALTDGHSYIIATPYTYQWPLGTWIWRNLTYSYTNYSNQRVYTGERNVHTVSGGDHWQGTTVVLSSDRNSATETLANGTVVTWYRQ